MKLLFKVLIPVLVLVGSAVGARAILDNRPEPQKRPQFPSVQSVEAATLTLTDYPVMIRSQGTVQPTQSTTLVAEVTGTITALSDNYVIGGDFSKGDVLLQIDERDYTIALTQAKANLAQATAGLQEERARGELAKTEWESLRRGKKASSLTLRLPQLAAARGNRDAAKAQVDRAELDLERTRFIAPFDGKILETSVNQGQFVARGSRLGQIYATSSVDVRLPLSSRQLTFLDIPSFGKVAANLLPAIELSAIVAGVKHTWQGKVVRAEGVDAATQQLNVIARVEQPFAVGKAPLRIGQYVEAHITGRVLPDVFVLPRAAVREDREVLLVNKDSQLERREISVTWADDEVIAVSEGLQAGDVLVTTPLSTVTNGTPVRATVDGVAPPRAEGRGNGQRGGQRDGQRGEGGSDSPAAEGSSGDGQRGQGKRAEGQRGGQRAEGQRGGQRAEGQRGQGRQNINAEGQQNPRQNPAAGKIDRSNAAVAE